MPPKPFLRMRTWGTRFDTLPTSPPVSPRAREATAEEDVPLDMPEQTVADSTLKRKEEKMPHDASVFVGRSFILLTATYFFIFYSYSFE